MRNINIKGILIDTDKTFHLHISFSIRSNGKNADIYVITSTRSKCLWTWSLFLLEERNKSFSLWKCKELPIQMITSFTFPLLNKKPFSFDSTSSTTNKRTWRPNAKDAMLISKVIVTNPPSSEVKVKTCKLFHFLFKRRKDLFTKFLCKYIKFKFTAMLPDESCIF